MTWVPERVVGPDLARELIEARFPDLRPATVELLGEGFDNTAYRVNGAWVFRFPRRQVAVALIEREMRLLPAIAPRVPLPIPIPEREGRGNEAFPWPFAGYRELRGQTACRASLSAGERAAAAAPIARFLAALHAFPAEEATRLGAPGDELDRTNVPLRVERARAALDELMGQGVLEGSERRGLERALDEAPTSVERAPNTLVHGDLYSRHILLDERRGPAGVIDWGDIHVGDRAVDLAIAPILLPPSAHDAFREAYGFIDADTWRLARFRAVYHAASVARFARAIADSNLLREARLTLRWVSGVSE